jgi:RNA polymerase sigma-B factor
MDLTADELRQLFVEYRKTGNRTIRNRLVEAHLALAVHLAKRFAHRGEPLEDLVQVASLGLLKATDRFDPSRATEFSTFAVPTIVGELKRHFRDKAWAVRVPRRMQELHLELAGAVADLTHELGRSPTTPELAERMGTSVESVLEAMEAGRSYRSESLDRPSASDAEAGPPSSAGLGEEDALLSTVAERSEVASLLSGLPERERTILGLRFFGGLTQSEIAERVGISQMHVSRILSKTLEALRERSDNSPETAD